LPAGHREWLVILFLLMFFPELACLITGRSPGMACYPVFADVFAVK
jgi:hypothetical protein